MDRESWTLTAADLRAGSRPNSSSTAGRLVAPVEPSVQAWREARGSEVEIVTIPEAEHELTLPDDTLAPEYERTLVEWLTRLFHA